jgi:hypothetical protein
MFSGSGRNRTAVDTFAFAAVVAYLITPFIFYAMIYVQQQIVIVKLFE